MEKQLSQILIYMVKVALARLTFIMYNQPIETDITGIYENYLTKMYLLHI